MQPAEEDRMVPQERLFPSVFPLWSCHKRFYVHAMEGSSAGIDSFLEPIARYILSHSVEIRYEIAGTVGTPQDIRSTQWLRRSSRHVR
jgi:hypothetical protein